MKKTLLLLVVMLIAGWQGLIAQTTKTVTGTVLDEQGRPVDGAMVKVKGDDGAATLTDSAGNFELPVPDNTAALVVDYFGNQKQVTLNGAAMPLKVTLGTNTVDEVVITDPYRKIVKENFTGAANQISADQLEKHPVTSFTKAIEGAAPGIQATNGGGQPGSNASFLIRGTSSISASSSPLIILDGGAYDGSLSSINPNDIETITVLKDAAATSLYGSRAAGGVVIVTTKHGKSNNGKARINIDAKYGLVTRFMPDYNVINNEKDYYEFSWQAYRNYLTANGYTDPAAKQIASGLNPGEAPGIVDYLGGYNSYNVASDALIDTFGHLNPGASLRYHDNWEDELTRVGKRNEYNLSISNANDKTDYYLSFGYLKEDGFVKYTDYERFTSRLNLNTQATNWLKAGLNVSATLGTQNYVEDGTTAGGYNPFFASRNNAPIYPVYYRDADGNKVIDPVTGNYKYDWGSLEDDPGSSMGNRATLPNSNVLGSMALDQNRTKSTNVVSSAYLEAKFLKDFTFRSNLSTTYYQSNNTAYNNPLHGQFAAQNGVTSKTNTNLLSYTWNQLLTWEHSFDKHHLNIVAGHENYDYQISALAASRAGVVSLGNTELTGMPTPLASTSGSDVDRVESYLANLSYDYNNRYFLTASVRRDGTSRFKDPWGTFWSVGGAWIVNQEEFLRNVNNLNTLKIKASYGTQGNQNISTYYGWQSLYSTGYPNGSYAGSVVSQLENDDLTWESQKQFNAGVEFRIFDRISGEFNYFNKTNADLLYYRPMAYSTGVIGRWENTITMVTNGLELELKADILRPRLRDGFNWNIDFNLTHTKDKITKMPTGYDSLYQTYGLWTKGHSIYDFYLVESAGVNPANGDELYYYTDADGNKDTTSVYATAYASSRKYVGNAVPKVFGAITNNFSYKNFDLSFMVSYALGGKYYDAIYQGLMGNQLSAGANVSEDMLDSWTPENTTASLPRAEYNNQNLAQTSTRFLVDASYLNIRNINLGYTFRDDLVKRMKLSSLRLYVSVENVWLFSKRDGMDPQAGFDGNPNYVYSPSRTVSFGLNVGL